MKNRHLVPSVLLLSIVSGSALANPADVSPSADQFSPSKIEKVYAIQSETATQPSIRLIRVDNGGSTDVSSVMGQSRLYLAIHKDGEMYDIDGNYLIAPQVNSVTQATLSGNRILLTYINKDDRLKDQTHQYEVLLSGALNEAKSGCAGRSEDEDMSPCELKSSIGMQNSAP